MVLVDRLSVVHRHTCCLVVAVFIVLLSTTFVDVVLYTVNNIKSKSFCVLRYCKSVIAIKPDIVIKLNNQSFIKYVVKFGF